jgi:hypothetical protein
VEAVKAREVQQQTVRAELAALDQLTQVGRRDRAQLERTARECLTDWQGLLAGQPVQARQMLRKLLEGRLVFTPHGRRDSRRISRDRRARPGTQRNCGRRRRA